MKISKRIISSILCVLLFISVLAACGKDGSPSEEPVGKEQNQNDEHTNKNENQDGEDEVEGDWLSAQKEKWYVGDNITFDWYLNYEWWPHNREWTEYPILKEISDITGVTPKVSIPAGDPTEKLNLMISTDSLPDMITLDFSDKNVERLIKAGLVYSYDELIEEYCPEFKDEIPEEIWRYISSDTDGKLYGLPSWFVPGLMPNNAISYNVRKDIYKELGSPDMTSIDGFKKALIDFKEKYPKIDGKESIPLSMGENYDSRHMMERSFGIREYYEDANRSLQHSYKDPKYVEFVKFINELYREKLLDQEGFIKKHDQIQEDWSTRTFCILTGWWGRWDVDAALEANTPGSGFMVTESLEAPGEKFEVGQNKLGWTISLINKKAENPEEILKFTRYLWSKDGNQLLIFGHEGEDYTIEGNEIIRSDEFTEAYEKDSEGYQEETGIFTFRFFQYSYWDNSLTGAFSESPERVKDRELANTYVTYDSTPYTYNMSPDPTTQEGIIANQVSEVINKEYPKIIMANSEQEAIKAYNEMIEKMDKVGLPTLEELWTNQYKKNLEKFKSEDY